MVLATIGCGSGSSEGKYGLSGTILLDGQRVEAGTISFAPEQEEGAPASAIFSDGKYSIDSKKGLKPGKYVVKIFANPPEKRDLSPEELMTHSSAKANRPETPQQKIPEDYNTKSTQVREVTENGPNVFDFDIKSK